MALPLLCGTAGASNHMIRAWQQRLKLELSLPVPRVELAAVNPFVAVVDELPGLLSSTLPTKLRISGGAVVAAYVNNRGECPGAVPLELPLPGLTSSLIDAAQKGRYEPAHSGDIPHSSWVVMEIGLESRVNKPVVIHQEFAFPDPQNPPDEIIPVLTPPSGQLLRRHAVPHEELTSLAKPKRIRFRAPAGERTISFQALVHISPEGRCDRYVPLLSNSGLDRWFSAYLATWSLDVPMNEGVPTEVWLVYTARIRLKFSSFSSTSFRVLRDRDYSPGS